MLKKQATKEKQLLLTTPQAVGSARPLDDGSADKTTAPQPQADPQTATTKTVTEFNPQQQSPESHQKKRVQTTTLSQFFKRV